jgi:hypothetical protein
VLLGDLFVFTCAMVLVLPRLPIFKHPKSFSSQITTSSNPTLHESFHDVAKILLALVLLLPRAASLPIYTRQAVPRGCVNISISVIALANNTALPPSLNLSNFVLLNPLIFEVTSQLASGTFNIAATYCPPSINVEGRENTLQVLVYG